MILRACSRKVSSPSLSEMEFTIPFPWRHLSPASMISHFEESTVMGTLVMSGSDWTRRRNLVIISTPSIRPSSKQMSMTGAPFSTCWRATARASSRRPSLIILRKTGEPATLVRSPIMRKFLSAVWL